MKFCLTPFLIGGIICRNWHKVSLITQKHKEDMKYKYVIDYPCEGKFILTDTRDGVSHEIAEKVAADLMSAQDALFSTKARFAINSVDCVTTK